MFKAKSRFTGLFGRVASGMLIAAASAMLSGCADPLPLYVDQAWIRLAPDQAAPAAGYMTVHGGPQEVKLLGVLSDRVQRIEMHESANEGGMTTMKPITSVTIPAETKVAFAPGGKHLMMFGVNAAEAREGKIPLTFLFSNGDRIIVDAVLQKAGAAASDAANDNAAAPATDNSMGNMADHAGH